ncbi:MAG: alpha-L-glutamate ligase-like protein [Proteobacteria bacterium]|nr:alpha-L-glutamate ligase-like protein [Pseudomonadota bacterium]
MNLISILKNLKSKGVLGINQRNIDYVLKYNHRSLYPTVDDKWLTKKLAIEAHIAVPELYGVIEEEHQLNHLEELLKPYKDFAIKPANGAGGEGILVISDHIDGRYRRTNGRYMKLDELAYHISNILSGIYSLGGQEDKALIEYRIKVDETFKAISYEGVPDIRIIVLCGYPIMAMLRLPTHLSDGKANLHQGAIGVGIDIATGKTLSAVWENENIEHHPDTLQSIRGRPIPHWDQILDLSSRCYELTGLGYIGVDIVLDKDYGPLMLEVNARPGLNIQIANQQGLYARTKIVEAQLEHRHPVVERVAFSKKHFGMST